jgi:N-acetylmuramoyl-L-alanine amidase
MNYWVLYGMKVVLFQSVCYLIYWLLLRCSNYFAMNRAYLMATLFLGFVAPLILLPSVFPAIDPAITQVEVIAGTFSDSDSISSGLSQDDEGFSLHMLATIVYAAGVLFLFIRSAVNMRLIRRMRHNGNLISSSPKVVGVKEPVSFAFIDTVFLYESASPLVLLHEVGHVEGKHWVDLMILEVTCIVCWANPMVWLYRKSLKQQHEYLADDYVLRHGISPEDYLHCILESLSIKKPIGSVHNFNSQSLKQRIIMMTRNQISPYTKYFYLALVPMLSLLFFSFTGTKETVSSIVSEKIFVIDPAHGGSDIGAAAASGVTEKEITLSLAKLVKEIGKTKGLNIRLTRSSDEQMSLADRVKFSADVKADAFVSIHVGFDANGVHKGLEVFISEANSRYDDSKKIAGILSGELDDVKEFNNPVVRSSGAYVLKHNHAPSAIIEAGNLSDNKDAAFISDPANQRIVAARIVSALMKY